VLWGMGIIQLSSKSLENHLPIKKEPHTKKDMRKIDIEEERQVFTPIKFCGNV
jgi:hypothetical protein